MTQFDAPVNILITKFNLPQLRRNVVDRPKLVQRLHGELAEKLTLVTAPAGAGKTTLLRTFAQQVERQVCWYTVDEDDNQSSYFLPHLIYGFQQKVSGIGQQSLDLLALPQSSRHETILTPFIAELAALTESFIYVFDDFHLIHNQDVLDTFSFLLEHTPPQIRFVVASREKPSLPLSKFRARHQLLVLDNSALRFDTSETRIFLEQTMQLKLDEAMVQLLEERAEGWATGLQLMALFLQHNRHAIDNFTFEVTEQRYIFEYLSTEIFERQHPEIQQFLLYTCLFPYIHATLGDTLVNTNQSHDILGVLERSNLFINAIDGDWRYYRYHQLFRDFLRIRLEQDAPDMIPILYQRAAQWHWRNGEQEYAIHYALLSQNYNQAANYIEQVGDEMWTHQDMYRFIQWIEPMPEHIRQRYPKVYLFYAWARVILGEHDLAEQYLTTIEKVLPKNHPPQSLWGMFMTIKSALLVEKGKQEALPLYEEALQLLQDSSATWQAAIYVGLGRGQTAIGDAEAAIQSLHSASRICKSIGNNYGAIYAEVELGQVYVDCGHLNQALRQFIHAVDFASRNREHPLLIIAWAYLGASTVYFHRNELDIATECILEAIHWGKQTDMKAILVNSYTKLARIQIALRQFKQAKGLISEADYIARATELPELQIAVDIEMIRLLLAQGKVQKAVSILEAWQLEMPTAWNKSIFQQFIIAIHVLLEQKQPEDALNIANHFLNLLPPALDGILLQINVLEAVALMQWGELGDAKEKLADAFKIAEPENSVRVFLDAGDTMQALLGEYLKEYTDNRFAQRILSAFQQDSPPPAIGQAFIEPFSKAELQILDLLAQGFTNQQIADSRVVSLNTVKWHLKNIYAKLQVRNRTAAVSTAQTLNLI